MPSHPSGAAKDLLRGVGIVAASLMLASTTSRLCIWAGEVNVVALRGRVFTTVTNREMEWSDRNVSGEDSAAGSMAKFSPLDVQISKVFFERDEVRSSVHRHLLSQCSCSSNLTTSSLTQECHAASAINRAELLAIQTVKAEPRRLSEI